MAADCEPAPINTGMHIGWLAGWLADWLVVGCLCTVCVAHGGGGGVSGMK